MATQAQIKTNRQNAQKSTGPKTAEGKAVVARNALKHGIFAHENVIKCEKQEDFDAFRAELLAGLAPVGGPQGMKIARIEAGSWDRSQRREAELLDSETGRSELALG